MQNVPTREFRFWPAVAVIALAAIVAGVLAGASIWQSSVSQSRLDERDDHQATATLLENARAEGAQAAQLLRTYVETGDAKLIAQVQTHATKGIQGLTAAIAQSGDEELNALASDGAKLAEGSGQVVALRQGGDVKGAAAALEAMSPQFEALTTSLDGIVEDEQAQASSLQSSADNADTIASWLLIAAIATAVTAGVVALFVVARGLSGPKVPRPASSL